jgi:transposase
MRRSGRTRQGNVWLRSAMVAAAQSAVRSRTTSFYAQYQRLKTRRGVKRAILAVAHSMLVCAYHIIQRREPYRELGPGYDERRQTAATTRKLSQRLRKLGFDVVVTPRANVELQGAAQPVFSG